MKWFQPIPPRHSSNVVVVVFRYPKKINLTQFEGKDEWWRVVEGNPPFSHSSSLFLLDSQLNTCVYKHTRTCTTRESSIYFQRIQSLWQKSSSERRGEGESVGHFVNMCEPKEYTHISHSTYRIEWVKLNVARALAKNCTHAQTHSIICTYVRVWKWRSLLMSLLLSKEGKI